MQAKITGGMPATFSRTMAALQADSGRRALVLMAAAVVVLGGWGAWFFFSRVALYETGEARLEVVREVNAVQAPVAGKVLRSLVALDRDVEAGALLVELDSTSLRLKLEETRIAQRALVEQLDSLRRVVEAEDRALTLARQAARASLQEARARHRERRVKADFNRDKASRLARLRKGGHLAEFDFLKAQADAEAGQTAAETLRISVDRLRRDQRTADSDRRAGLARLSAELVKIKGQLATTAGAIKRLHHEIERRRIRAPVAGRIGELTPLRIGAYVDEGQKICTVVPRGDLRAVGLLSPTTAMGRVRPGQKARLRLHGFPWIQYGSVPATVTRVAREPSQGRLRVELSVQPDPGSRIPIQHGLPGVLEIEVERVRPWTLVLRTAGKLISDRPPPPAGGVE